jgi:hypothetical protein
MADERTRLGRFKATTITRRGRTVTKDYYGVACLYHSSFLKQNIRSTEGVVGLVGDELAVQAALGQREIQVVIDLHLAVRKA